MPGRQNYPQEYVDYCQQQIESQLSEMRDMPPVPTSFAQRLAAHLIIVMDACFAQRVRGADASPLNEVRVLAHSLMQGTTVVEDSTIEWTPHDLVLGLEIDDDIALSVSDVDRLQQAFFAEMNDKHAV
ncbi:MAG: hypothetical protein WB508_01935 [Aeromicrobium sp.]|uniref:hypothetical protein n=1 Tax=Aeromicrobium sp. TaxID=1871063 RepID=UPI003C3FDDCC